jgi:hypothetical protein
MSTEGDDSDLLGAGEISPHLHVIAAQVLPKFIPGSVVAGRGAACAKEQQACKKA